jgi:hypothetical protein
MLVVVENEDREILSTISSTFGDSISSELRACLQLSRKRLAQYNYVLSIAGNLHKV